MRYPEESFGSLLLSESLEQMEPEPCKVGTFKPENIRGRFSCTHCDLEFSAYDTLADHERRCQAGVGR